MSHERRILDRRRRVIYAATQGDHEPATAASRRETLRLREARRPSATYGSRVNRRLRGRWFSLVPVHWRSLIATTAAIMGVAMGLVLMNYLAMVWPAFADRPALNRPFRLNASDSFGCYLSGVVLALAAGTSLLIYQLRRYRIDDFLGHYRLWRIMLILLLLASMNTQVGLVRLAGGILDECFGPRVALAGSDWIGILLSVSGAIFAIRMLAEVRRSRWAVSWLSLAWALMAIPVADRWNVIVTGNSTLTMAAVMSAPLLSHSALWVALVGYLRMLLREVRHVDDDSADKQQAQPATRRSPGRSILAFWKPDRQASPTPSRKDSPGKDQSQQEPQPESPGRFARWRARRAEAKTAKRAAAEAKSQARAAARAEARADAEQAKQAKADAKRAAADAKRAAADAKQAAAETERAEAESERARATNRRGESLPRREPDADRPDPPATQRRGLGSWFRRSSGGDDSQSESDSGSATAAPSPAMTRPAAARNAPPVDDASDDESDDGDDAGDLSHLSKAERRRMRKMSRRQDRAA